MTRGSAMGIKERIDNLGKYLILKGFTALVTDVTVELDEGTEQYKVVIKAEILSE